MTQQKPLSLVDPQAASIKVQNVFTGGALPYGKRRGRSSVDAAQLALALIMLVMLSGLIYFSELDNTYWINARITSFVQRAFGNQWAAHDGRTAKARRVIVVENDESQRLIAKTTLERYGYTVVLATSGTQAQTLLRRSGARVDLVILDREGLGNSTRDTIRQLKSIQPSVRILISQAAGEDLPAATEVAPSIERPLSAAPLADAVKKVLATK